MAGDFDRTVAVLVDRIRDLFGPGLFSFSHALQIVFPDSDGR